MADKHCSDCKDGDHPDYDDNIRLVWVRDMDTNKLVKRSYMCAEHRQMYSDDGYFVGFCN